MNLTLYKNNSGVNVINKNLVLGEVIDVLLKRGFDIDAPKLYLHGVDLREYNYFFLAGGIDRYYFIDSVEIVSGGVVQVNATCDFLETYKNDILDSWGNYRKVVTEGDFGELNVVETGRVDEVIHNSNVSLEPSNKAILSVIGGYYG